MDSDIDVSVVIPLYDEELNLPELYRRLSEVLRATGLRYELCPVDDGSADRTAALLHDLEKADEHVVPVYLARNFGHQAAVTAGLDFARGRAVVVMDGDLQDPPEELPGLLALWKEGFDVVHAVRADRKEGPLIRLAYYSFYRLFRLVAEVDIALDSGDFCLMDREVVDAMRAMPERQRFARGLRSWLGFRQTRHIYSRAARQAGSTKYSLRRLVGLAVDGLISFSGRPLRAATVMGGLSAGVAVLLMLWVFWDASTRGEAPRGWASVMTVVLFLGGVQLVGLGVQGEYLRIIFLEAKGRPTYIARKKERTPR